MSICSYCKTTYEYKKSKIYKYCSQKCKDRSVVLERERSYVDGSIVREDHIAAYRIVGNKLQRNISSNKRGKHPIWDGKTLPEIITCPLPYNNLA